MKGGTHEITHRLFFLERPYGTDCKNACRQNKGGGLSGLKEIRLTAQITKHVPKSKARLTQKRSCGLP